MFIERQPRLLRPVNYPPGTPGRGANLYTAARGQQVLVVNPMGRVFMDALDDPFAAIERELGACPLGVGCDAIVVDMHAETSSEKMAMGAFRRRPRLAGRRHAYACADRRRADPARRHRPI